VHVVGVALVPHRGDTNLRLGHVVLKETHAIEHDLGSDLRLGLHDRGVVLVEIHQHLRGGLHGDGGANK